MLTGEMEKYEVVKELGSGNFGVARLMRNKETKEMVAMKYLVRGHKVFLSMFLSFSGSYKTTLSSSFVCRLMRKWPGK